MNLSLDALQLAAVNVVPRESMKFNEETRDVELRMHAYQYRLALPL